MSEFRRDPIQKAVYGKHGLMQAIEVLFESECYIPGLMLVLCGIDIMSNLDRPKDSLENSDDDFKNWVKRYIHIPRDNGLTPEDVWSTRNALLHTYGVYSRATRSGKARIITFVPNKLFPVRTYENAPELVHVDPFAFREAFSNGVRDFLTSSLSNPEKKPLMEERLNELVTYLPFEF